MSRRKTNPLADRSLAYSLLSNLSAEDVKLILAEARRRENDRQSLCLNPESPFFDLLHTAADFKVYYGGRDSAKSWSGAEAAIRRARAIRTRFLCTRQYQTSIKESIHQLLKDTIERMGLTHEFRITDREITHKKTKSNFIFKGLYLNDDDIKSTEGIDVCLVEEAHFVSDESWQLLIPTIRKPGAEIWIFFNTPSVEAPTYKRFILNPPESCIIHKVNFDQNPFLSENSKRNIAHLKKTDFEKYRHIYEGEPLKISEATIFKNFVMRPFPDDLWKKGRLFFGSDFGFAKDPSTLVRSFIIDKTLYVEYEAGGVEIEFAGNMKDGKGELEQLYDSVPDSRKWPIFGDSSRPETISFLKGKGFLIRAAEKWQGSVEDGIAHLKGFTEIVIHPRCKRTYEEFTLYSYKVDQRTGDILPIIVDAFNHYIDAIRYSLNGYIKRGDSREVWKKLAS